MPKKNTKLLKRRQVYILIAIISAFCLIGGAASNQSIHNYSQELQSPQKPVKLICDGIEVTENCEDDDGVLYSKYVYHEAEEEVTKEVRHPAVPEKTHTVYHETEYGTRQVQVCVRATIGERRGSCALSRCADGAYSGSSGRGTCSHHGGVVGSGPWYTTQTETYVVRPAWTETVVDEPAKEAWTETVVVSPAKEAYYEKVPAQEDQSP